MVSSFRFKRKVFVLITLPSTLQTWALRKDGSLLGSLL